MAICITANITDIEHGWVSRYFARCRSLAPLGIPVSENVQRVQDRSFIGLLAAIQAANDSKVVVVTHGFSDGSGLFLPLYPTAAGLPTSAPYTTDDMLYRLSGIAQDADAKRPLSGPSFSVKSRTSRGSTLTRWSPRPRRSTPREGEGADRVPRVLLGKNTDLAPAFRRFLGAKASARQTSTATSGASRTGVRRVRDEDARDGHTGSRRRTLRRHRQGKCLVCMSLNAQNKPAAGPSSRRPKPR
jgi:hypothetical protein